MARIAVDAMGGDLAPQETVLGAIDAVEAGCEVVLVGDSTVVGGLLDGQGVDLPVVHAAEVIDMAEDPAAAIRAKKSASITVAARLVATGEAAGLVSAGSTGATLAAAATVIGRVAGVSRPALAVMAPLSERTIVLDAGANIEVRPEHLVEFAVMGSVLARVYLGKEDPSVGLLNIGEEENKGRELERQAYALLAAAPVRFVGNVEGRDLGTPRADVFVTDGFTGNVLLKTFEGTARAVGRLVGERLVPGEGVAAGGAPPSPIAGLWAGLDAEDHGGAHLLGTRGTVVIAHGSSTRRGVSNAVRLAAEGSERDLVGRIGAVLSGA
jgi:glycerol-3-phosphate acyltransferase PlsX